MYKILIADDETSIISGLELFFQKYHEFELFTALDEKSAISILEDVELDLVLTDLMIPELENGLSIIKTAKSKFNNPAILAMTGLEIIDNVVRAMKAGADDLIIKGFDKNELLIRIRGQIKKNEIVTNLTVQNAALKTSLQNQFCDYKMIGSSKHILDIKSLILKIAQDATSTCIITGPSGCGKELVARSIHEQSNRKDQPFITVNCAAIPDALIESELFGHEKGSFTGAVNTRVGKFEQAGKGIIFLDEIGDLPVNLQMRLLRVLENRCFNRVGGNNEFDANAMVLAATNKNLRNLVETGKFREDLYYRLDVVNIDVKPLKDHEEDIPILAKFFLKKLNIERNNKIKFTDKALKKLSAYNFPGNVRELRNIIENAFVFANESCIYTEDLHFKESPNQHGRLFESMFELSHQEAVRQFERKYFADMMFRFNGKITDASKQADISSEWFGKKLKQLNLK